MGNPIVRADAGPRRAAVPFEAEAAAPAATLYAKAPRPHGRDLDMAIPACAVMNSAALWTLNHDDFRDIPGLELV